MGVMQWWPLGLLVLLPGIVALYMLKQRAKDKKISSLYLWREAYINQRADTPWEKLRHHLLMYLQLAAMGLLILAMLAPYWRGSQEERSNVILVLDRSASMEMERQDGRTRLEAAKEEAIRYLEGLSGDTGISLVAVDETGTILLSDSRNKATVEQAIRELAPTRLAGDVSRGDEVYRSLTALYDDYEIVAFTDTPVTFGDLAGSYIDVADEVTNLSVDIVSHSKGEALEILVKVTNHSQAEAYRGDLSLYLAEELIQVQTIELAADTSDVFYFESLSIPVELQEALKEGLPVTVRLSGHDALAADNEGYDILQQSGEGRVLLVTKQNTFVEQALRVHPDLTVFKTDDPEIADGYDLYLYDGLFPEELPEEGAVFLIHAASGQYPWLLGEESEDSGYLTFTEHTITKYLAGFRTGYAGWYTYDLPAWGEEFLTDPAGGVVGFTGVGETGNRVAVLGVDLHQGDLPLQSEYPIFVSELITLLLDQPEPAEVKTAFPAGESGILPHKRVGAVDGSGQVVEGETNLSVAARRSGTPLQGPILVVVLALLAAISLIFLTRYLGESRIGAREKRKARGKEFSSGRTLNATILFRAFPLLRLATAALILLAMAGITISGRSQGVTTIYLLDVSDSMEGTLKEAENFIKEAQALGTSATGREASAVVAFGGDAKVEQFVSEETLFTRVGTKPVKSATNLERAVQTALALIPEETAGRIVLLTDGGETEGDVTDLIRGVKERQVAVQVVSFTGGSLPESYVKSLTVPGSVDTGEDFLLTVEVESNVRAKAFLTLYEGTESGGERIKETREVELSPGRNQYVFADTRTGEGLVTYRAVLESGEDTRSVNNQYTAFTSAKAPAKMLVLERTAGESEALMNALAAAGVQAEVRLAGNAPGNILELTRYAGVILVDVPVSALRAEFLQVVEGYVKDYGGGLIAVGGDSSYALGGYKDTALETVLPVNMELEQDVEVPSLSMVYVIDKSGSMGNGIAGDATDKLGVAKSAAADAIDNLRDMDRVGVIAFDDKYEWVQKLTQADNRSAIKNAIGAIQPGGGTSIYPGVDAAAKALKEDDSKLKHIVLLTDGQDSYGYYDPLMEDLTEWGITLSTVAIGSDADVTLLSRLAEDGGGRHYQSTNLSELPEIFAQEIWLSMGEYLVNRTFTPVVTYSGELLSGVANEGLYPLFGYVGATEKPLSTVYLESDSGDPILTSIQYGLGRTVAWQSDVTGQWNAAYEGTGQYVSLWKNLTDWIQTELSDGDGNLTATKEGNKSLLTYETENYSAETSVTAVYTDREGNSQSVELLPSAPGVYTTEVELKENEAYSLFLTKKEGDQVVAGQLTGLATQYSREYQFADDKGLTEFLAATGGRTITSPEDVFSQAEQERQQGREQRSLSTWFLLAAVVTFLIDIVLRRFDIRVGKRVSSWIAAWRQRRQTARLTARAKKAAQAQKEAQTQQAEIAGESVSAEKAEKSAKAEKAKAKRQKHDMKPAKKEENLLDTSALLKRKEERTRL